MVIRDKAYLKNKFKTGDIPTGQDFADFIDTFVASLDEKTPDSQGNVASFYRIIEPIAIDQPPSVYPDGTTEFYVDYDPSDFEDYLDEYPSAAIITAGKLCVRTFNVNGTVSQQVDNSKDGVFKAAYARVCEDANAWGPIIELGNSEIVDNLNTQDGTKALSANMGSILKDSLERHETKTATAEELGHVKVDDETIVINNDGVISAVGAAPNPDLLPKASTTIEGIVKLTNALGTSEILAPTQKNLNDVHNSIPTLYTDLDEETTGKALDATQGKALRDMIEDNKVIVDDELDSTSTTNALSANMGSVLYGMANNINDYLQDHMQDAASAGALGHVRIDNDTIKIETDTKRIYVPKASATQSGAIKVDGTTIKVTDGVIRADHTGLVKKVEGLNPDANGNVDIPTASTTRLGKVMLNDTLIGTSTTQALTANQGRQLKVNADAHEAKKATTSELGHVKVDGTTITAVDGVISAVSTTVPDATTSVKGVVQLASSVNNATTTATTPAAVQNAINAHVSIIPTNSIRGHVKSDGVSTTIDATGTIKAKTKLNRIWDSRPILANATTWTVDFSDETALTDLNNYWFEVYDDGVLVFGNPITYVVNNTTKTVTFTPQNPMGRAFTITCIGRGMEF